MMANINWTKTVQEAAATQMPGQLRNLFATMLVNCQVPDPCLWETFQNDLSEDILNTVRRQNSGIEATSTPDI
jgi:hypothetical protein